MKETVSEGFFLFIPEYSLEDYKNCVQAGLKVGANIEGVYVSVGFHGGSCDGLLNEMGGGVSCLIIVLSVCLTLSR